MQKSKLVRNGRKGFTLVEVALAVAVGLIVIGGAIVGFNAVRQNASDSSARQKVDAAVAILENYAGGHNGLYPQSVAAGGAFGTMWKTARTDYNASPWGGPVKTTNGVKEYDEADFGGSSVATATTDKTTLATAADGAGDLLYINAKTNLWGSFKDHANNDTATVVKNYVVALFDKEGNPFWYVRGGAAN